ncbi:hypothetical protein CTEN210_08084 [Chaetoceros tenuissimus]|uniref:Trichohyalin-plectin-homology domain-containing protein n=1 Tax=Chaetoceros tenuissimus TaxID=426638 RepID=A0AAD3CSY6_9STRA|nr:hypothetical protein CTEN210_08084 [Chaetoceros tenuissimus]
MTSSLARKRNQENILYERQAFLKDEAKLTQIARWEHSQVTRDKTAKFESFIKDRQFRDESLLEQRREALKNLYLSERKQWKSELEESQKINFIEQMEKVRERALSLQKKRKEEEEEFVKKQLSRRREDNCDESRTLKEKKKKEQLALDRQAVPPRPVLVLEDEDDQSVSQGFPFSSEDPLDKRRKNQEMKMALDEQVKHLRQIQNEEYNLKISEEKAQLELWELQKLKEKKKKEESLRQEKERQKQVSKENTIRLEELEAAKRRTRKEELSLLEQALRKEEAQQNEEKILSERNQGQGRAYMVFLKEQMVKDKEDYSKTEAIRNKKLELEWEKRAEKEELKEIQNKKLLKEVQKSREQQIREKILEQEELRKVEATEVAKAQETLEKQLLAEKEKQRKKQKDTVSTMLYNKRIIEAKERSKKSLTQENFLAKREFIFNEMKYDNKVRDSCCDTRD